MHHKRRTTTVIEHEIDVQYADLVRALRLIGAIPADVSAPVRITLYVPEHALVVDLDDRELIVQWQTTGQHTAEEIAEVP